MSASPPPLPPMIPLSPVGIMQSDSGVFLLVCVIALVAILLLACRDCCCPQRVSKSVLVVEKDVMNRVPAIP